MEKIIVPSSFVEEFNLLVQNGGTFEMLQDMFRKLHWIIEVIDIKLENEEKEQ